MSPPEEGPVEAAGLMLITAGAVAWLVLLGLFALLERCAA